MTGQTIEPAGIERDDSKPGFGGSTIATVQLRDASETKLVVVVWNLPSRDHERVNLSSAFLPSN